MTPGSSTITRTASITYTDVQHLVWKIKSDMYQLRQFHNCFSQAYVDTLSEDIYQWIYSGYADEFRFKFYAGKTVTFELRYDIVRGITSSIDDDAGRIPFDDLAETEFAVFVSTNDAWGGLTEDEKQEFYKSKGFNLKWGQSTLALTYSSGYWSADNTYSKNSISAKRSVYRQNI